jgi:hypothetical protein
VTVVEQFAITGHRKRYPQAKTAQFVGLGRKDGIAFVVDKVGKLGEPQRIWPGIHHFARDEHPFLGHAMAHEQGENA